MSVKQQGTCKHDSHLTGVSHVETKHEILCLGYYASVSLKAVMQPTFFLMGPHSAVIAQVTAVAQHALDHALSLHLPVLLKQSEPAEKLQYSLKNVY